MSFKSALWGSLHIDETASYNKRYARELLEKVARQVEPIMRAHQWTVARLCELPYNTSNRNLLGYNKNAGQEIRVRLRPSGDGKSFLSEQSVLATMLHELTHNVHGPHDAKFYKLLDQLKAECKELISKGITSDRGRDYRTGGRRLTREQMRAVWLKRAKTMFRGGSGKVGGGDAIDWKSMTPQQAAAAAAERRLNDTKWCGCGKAQEKRKLIDLIEENDDDDDDNNIDNGDGDDDEIEILPRKKKKKKRKQKYWYCMECTMKNHVDRMHCQACDRRRGGN